MGVAPLSPWRARRSLAVLAVAGAALGAARGPLHPPASNDIAHISSEQRRAATRHRIITAAIRAVRTTTTTTTTAPPRPAPTSPPSHTSPPRPTGSGVHAAGTTSSDPLQRSREALASAIPPRWLSVVDPRLELIGGATSWSSTDGTIRVSRYHAQGPYERLRAVLAHEWGHQVAYRYGTRTYLGAPPDGWPYQGPRPAEAWGDCVAQTLTGINPSRHPGECTQESLQYIRDFLARGPA